MTEALHAERLIPLETKEYVQTATGISDYRKSSQLVSVIQRQLESSLNPEQYLIDICQVLINQQHCTLIEIATSILHQLGECVYIISDQYTIMLHALGQSIPDNVSSHTKLFNVYTLFMYLDQ